MDISCVMTERLLLIASKVEKGATVADIGTDHAYIPIYLVQNKISSNICAADIVKGPLKIAQKHIEEYGFSDSIKTVLSDGLDNISGEYKTIIIAGMGGMVISDILSKADKRGRNFILQPMTAEDDLREYLYENNFEITDEALAKEGDKLYTVICAREGKMERKSPLDFIIGEKLIENNDALLPELIKRQIKKTEKIIEGNKKAKNKKEEILEYFSERLSLLKNLEKRGIE